jgi:hypothetical protein
MSQQQFDSFINLLKTNKPNDLVVECIEQCLKKTVFIDVGREDGEFEENKYRLKRYPAF